MNMFNSVSIRRPKRAKFDLTHRRVASIPMGTMIPMLVQEVLPGDVISNSSEMMARFAPMLAPIMHPVDVKMDFFYTPNRILWDEWEDFITKGRLGTSAPVHPYMRYQEADQQMLINGTLADYLGVPDGSGWDLSASSVDINALPFRAYQLIYDEYYRNQNVTASIGMPTTSGQIVTGSQLTLLNTLRTSAWEKDYFTSALPWTQRGSEVLIPMEGEVSVDPTVAWTATKTNVSAPTVGNLVLGAPTGPEGPIRDGSANNLSLDPNGGLDFENATITINDLRRAERLQEWLEKNAVAGGRYKEHLKAHFDVNSSDARLQRPEYFGGGRQHVVISEVLSTVESASETVPQANMAGHGVSIGRSNRFRRRFEEHGWVIGIVRIMPRTMYQQGIPKELQRMDTFDYATPEFANVGEQPVLKREIYADPADASYTEIFGYQSRYAEYKYKPSTVHGDMRGNLDFWHMGRKFDAPQILNQSFIEADPTSRIFAVGLDAQKIYIQCINKMHAIRPLPYFGTPIL